jgi:hypothetical protein
MRIVATLAPALAAMIWAPLALSQARQVGSLRPPDNEVFPAAAGPEMDRTLSPDRARENPADADQPSSPYSSPFQLRSAAPSNTLRIDHDATPYESSSAQGSVRVTSLLASYKFAPSASISARGAMVNNNARDSDDASSFTNPIVGALWGTSSKPLRYALALSFAAPVGSGGGNRPDPAVVRANKAGYLARFAMDGSWFAVNDFSAAAGGDLAYVADGLTAQIEGTVSQLFRARGEEQAPDEYKANLLSGMHAGYWLFDELCVASELRYQRWLTTPAAVDQNPAARQNLSLAVGLRTKVGTGGSKVMPAVAYATGVYGMVAQQRLHAIHIDVPFVF